MYKYLLENGGRKVFGYVKAYQPELKLRENEFYRAVYCGLCSSMKDLTGAFSTFSLSYDMVFLILCRLAASGDRYEVKLGRCRMNPLKMKKRPVMSDGAELRYAAAVAALLTECKLEDDAADEKGVKRAAKRMLLSGSKRRLVRAKVPTELEERVRTKLSELYALEAQKPNEISSLAELFGELLGDIFAYGFDGSTARILYEIGRGTGRYIYILDAADDAEDDIKCGRYNPVDAVYGNLTESARDELLSVIKLELAPSASALELIEVPDGGYPETLDIAKNIIYLGMPKEAERVLCGSKKVH